ncbi:sulfotransferase domain-containing protein [Salinibacter ruber]|uniref:sulfotransferase domain-containing protein n=1 Tax=Salinibacter ruber TaxID=146919 RepID=UPI002072B6E4|nr:sulfotransferase domain-containing protein [Salinibacter ruber]
MVPDEWVRDVAAGRRIEDDPRVITVRYEDLVRDHLQVLRRVCKFLDEPFVEEAFRAYPDSSQFQESRAWYGEAREVTATSVGRWKQDEHESVVKRLCDADGAHELLEHYEYINR